MPFRLPKIAVLSLPLPTVITCSLHWLSLGTIQIFWRSVHSGASFSYPHIRIIQHLCIVWKNHSHKCQFISTILLHNHSSSMMLLRSSCKDCTNSIILFLLCLSPRICMLYSRQFFKQIRWVFIWLHIQAIEPLYQAYTFLGELSWLPHSLPQAILNY